MQITNSLFMVGGGGREGLEEGYFGLIVELSVQKPLM